MIPPDFSHVSITREMISHEYDAMLREFWLRQKLLDEARCKLFRLHCELVAFDRKTVENSEYVIS